MLELKHLRKEYDNLVAVNDLSFQLEPGDVFGFIGSNGAGKTTTIRMLATLLEPSSGTAILNGCDIHRDPMGVRRQVGFMPDDFGVYEDLKAWEYLDMFATIYRVKDKAKVIDNVLELTDLVGKRDAMVSALSRGMRQRLSLARCLVHDPQLLLLDEPASGLDPRARAELKELIAELGRMGKIVIISSHILPELADFCNMVGIIERGELLAFGSVRDVARDLQHARVIEIKFVDRAAEASLFLHGKPHVLGTNLMGHSTLKVEFGGDTYEQADLLRALVNAGYPITEFREEGADLEDVFLRVTTGAVQ